ncbi:Phasin family protein [Candidatus Bealeia paramacronuclearis]|uniref:Phasin family protein n=1 Tax=Candidatus Bealeia paramacronuclearis TaxID=1921001 RepID=A0ABZ2C4G2_9PROT|nr:Phasin family protein [Candidatus Bealeia paramacronuclearis]
MAKQTNNDNFQSNPFSQDYTKFFRDFKVPHYDMESVMTTYRKNLDILNSTQQVIADATRNLVQIQTQYMKQLFEDLSQQTKENLTSSQSMEDKTASHTRSVKDTIDHAISHTKEVNHLLTQTNTKVMDTVQKCLKESVDECANIVTKVQQTGTK